MLQNAYRNAMGKLLAVVSNVVTSPENAAFRHIPKDNARTSGSSMAGTRVC